MIDFLKALIVRVQQGEIRAIALVAIGEPDIDGVALAVGEASPEQWAGAISDLSAMVDEDDWDSDPVDPRDLN